MRSRLIAVCSPPSVPKVEIRPSLCQEFTTDSVRVPLERGDKCPARLGRVLALAIRRCSRASLCLSTVLGIQLYLQFARFGGGPSLLSSIFCHPAVSFESQCCLSSCPLSPVEILACACFHQKGPQKWSLKRETECFTAPGAVAVGLARVLSNCHFGPSVRPSVSEGTRRGGQGRVARKESKLRRFDICFVQTCLVSPTVQGREKVLKGLFH